MTQYHGKTCQIIYCSVEKPTTSSTDPGDTSTDDRETEGIREPNSSGPEYHSSEDSEDNDNPDTSSAPQVHNVGIHPAAISSGDFGQVVQLKSERDLTDNEKLFLLRHHFVPSKNYQFPAKVISGRTRHFQSSWLDQYNGLVYSELEDGGYCKFCVLFGKCGPSVKELGVLVNRPFTNFKKASEKLTEHFGSQAKKFHKAAVESAMAFTAAMENQGVSIDQQLISARQKLIAKNRLKLRSIVQAVIFCGRQGIAFRGHRDDGPVLTEESDSRNQGNFRALLQFRIDAGDEVLKEHLQTADRNAMYTSKEIQNEMIAVCWGHHSKQNPE